MLLQCCLCATLLSRGANGLSSAFATYASPSLDSEQQRATTKATTKGSSNDWRNLLTRPGEMEARSILRLVEEEVEEEERKQKSSDVQFFTDDGNVASDPATWWTTVFPDPRKKVVLTAQPDQHQRYHHQQHHRRPNSPEPTREDLELETWRAVQSVLGDDANVEVRAAAKEASLLLARWAMTVEEGSEYIKRSVSSVEYLMGTPFGVDPACVAAALLCEAHEAPEGGFSLDDLKVKHGDWVQLLRSLSNLSQLYRLQHARWDAEGELLWHIAENEEAAEEDDDEDDGGNLLRRRLPTTHADNLQQMLVAIASDFRALPLLLVRRLRSLREELACADALPHISYVDSLDAAAPMIRSGSSSLMRRRRQQNNEHTEEVPCTLEAMSKLSSLARDALDVLAPLAERFGLYKLKNDLEDAAFERLAPRARSRIVRQLDVSRDDRLIVLEDVSMRLRRILKEDDVLANSVRTLRVSTREKEPYSVWRKQRKKKQSAPISEEEERAPPHDAIALRVIIEPLPERKADADALCYHVLKLVESTWTPIKDRKKDYVASPKPNGYQSIHTTALMRLHGYTYPFEVQIRTRKMHLVAEFGSAAHALYSHSEKKQSTRSSSDDLGEPLAAAPAYLPDVGSAQDHMESVAQFAAASSSPPPKVATAHSGRRLPSFSSSFERELLMGIFEDPESGGEMFNEDHYNEEQYHQETNHRNSPVATALATMMRGSGTVPVFGGDREAELGTALGASLGNRLRQERVFVLASGGRVITVGAKSNAIDVRKALISDLEADAKKSGASLQEVDRRSGGHLEINGKRVEWLASLSTKLLNGDEVNWVPTAHQEDNS